MGPLRDFEILGLKIFFLQNYPIFGKNFKKHEKISLENFQVIHIKNIRQNGHFWPKTAISSQKWPFLWETGYSIQMLMNFLLVCGIWIGIIMVSAKS